jgi:hypothetical protein
MSWARDTSGVVNTTKKIARMVDADDIKEQKRMAKPETIKDIIEETMRVSGVPYPVPVQSRNSRPNQLQAHGHYEHWDVVLKRLSLLESKGLATTEEFKVPFEVLTCVWATYLRRSGLQEAQKGLQDLPRKRNGSLIPAHEGVRKMRTVEAKDF